MPVVLPTNNAQRERKQDQNTITTNLHLQPMHKKNAASKRVGKLVGEAMGELSNTMDTHAQLQNRWHDRSTMGTKQAIQVKTNVANLHAAHMLLPRVRMEANDVRRMTGIGVPKVVVHSVIAVHFQNVSRLPKPWLRAQMGKRVEVKQICISVKGVQLV